jgi:CDP-6-deoxy-D-xylo-4-hexulose-3-dehydrase
MTSSIDELKPALEKIMEAQSRVNSFKSTDYWYPLALATYGVDEVLEALESMCSFRTTMWDKTRQFEESFGELHQAEAIMVNSGSSADLLSSFLLHKHSGGPLETGDEVLIPAVTWPTQVWSLLMAGFKPRFVDVDPETLNIDLDDFKRKITSKSRALALVHLMGNSSDMPKIQRICADHQLELIEDCCEALGTESGGRKVGTFGQTGTFSFFFSHHITTMEGGMVITQDGDLADRLRLLRAHGWSRNARNPQPPMPGLDPRYTFVSWGFNVRPTELQAGFGIVQLTRLPSFQSARERNALRLLEIFSEYQDSMYPMKIGKDVTCSWFTFPVLVRQDAPFTRDELTAYLETQGIETRPIVAGNLARQPAMEHFPDLRDESLAGADFIHQNGFYLGVHPIDFGQQIDRLGLVLSKFEKLR